MGEIVFLFGMFFGVCCGLMLNKCDHARMRWLESERERLRETVRYMRRPDYNGHRHD